MIMAIVLYVIVGLCCAYWFDTEDASDREMDATLCVIMWPLVVLFALFLLPGMLIIWLKKHGKRT